MYLRSGLFIERAPIIPDTTADPLWVEEADEAAEEIAEAHCSLRFLAKYTTPDRRAKLEAAMRALEDVEYTVGEIQEDARRAEKAGG